MARSAHRLTFADDGSAGADVVWLWLNNHAWPGWAVEVLTVHPVTAGPPTDRRRPSQDRGSPSTRGSCSPRPRSARSRT